MSHIGIRLRISTPPGPIIDATSDQLHYSAKYGGYCLPGCQEHGWLDVLGGPDMRLISLAGLTIEIKPVDLPDDYPDDEEDTACSCICANCSGCTG